MQEKQADIGGFETGADASLKKRAKVGHLSFWFKDS